MTKTININRILSQEIIDGESMEGMEMDGDESKPGDESPSNALVKKSKGENGNPVVPGVKPTQGSVDLNLPIPNQKGDLKERNLRIYFVLCKNVFFFFNLLLFVVMNVNFYNQFFFYYYYCNLIKTNIEISNR